MTHKYFFQYNIPADNHTCGETNTYIDVIATWNTNNFYSNGKPMTITQGVNLTFVDCLQIKDWHQAFNDISRIGQEHFADLAREERINQARKVLALEENPIIQRFEIAV